MRGKFKRETILTVKVPKGHHGGLWALFYVERGRVFHMDNFSVDILCRKGTLESLTKYSENFPKI